VAKSAKSPSSQLKEGRSTAGTACPSTGNPGSDFTNYSIFSGTETSAHIPVPKPISGYFSNTVGMAGSWKEAKECAEREGFSQVYHDCDDKVYGACRPGEQQGCFKGGVFIEHRCICMPALMDVEELEAKEKKFLRENPEW
jgi:hypothetical protein